GADFQKQIDRRIDAVDADGVQRAALEAQRPLAIIQLIIKIIFPVLDRCPADDGRLDLIKHALRDIHHGNPFGAEQIFVRVGGKRIHRVAHNIKLQAAQPLNRVNEEEHAALAAEASNLLNVRAKAACKLYPTEG